MAKQPNIDKPKKKSIMIVDDTESMRLLIGSYFENDYDVTLMPDGQEALYHLKDKNTPDLILLDMEMPNMNGRIFLRRLRYHPVLKNVPVIFITTVNSRLMISSMHKLGISDYIIKPFKAEEIKEKVSLILKEKESSDAN